jgi:hypothetical protein
LTFVAAVLDGFELDVEVEDELDPHAASNIAAAAVVPIIATLLRLAVFFIGSPIPPMYSVPMHTFAQGSLLCYAIRA